MIPTDKSNRLRIRKDALCTLLLVEVHNWSEVFDAMWSVDGDLNPGDDHGRSLH